MYTHKSQKTTTGSTKDAQHGNSCQPHQLRIFYGTQTGTSKQFSEQLAVVAKERGISVNLTDLKDCDPEDCLTQQVSTILYVS